MLMLIVNSFSQAQLYTNNLKNREFDKEAPQIFCSERVTIAERQGTSENEKCEAKPTRSKTDSSSCLCILPQHGFDGIELRLDRFETLDFLQIEQLIQKFRVLLTVRTSSHGGSYLESEVSRFRLIEKLLELRPHYFDLEYDTSPDFLEKISKNYPDTKLILSAHDFEKTPQDLEALLQKMLSPCAFGYKIACLAQSSLDAMRMSAFVRKKTQNGMILSGICMGKLGQLTRIWGPIAGNLFDYASNEAPEDQLSIDTLRSTYHYPRLNTASRIYGLIGDPVDKSISHVVHNQTFREISFNGVYVKILIKSEELAAFFSHLRSLPFDGLSVTMPHKEAVIPFLDELSEDAKIIGAVNTIAIKQGKLCGYNTDGSGALNALEEKISVRGKKLILLGAGGTARAIGFEAQKRGAHVTILNRTPHKAKLLADLLGCSGYGLEKIKELDYDILVNATSVGMLDEEIPLDAKWIFPEKTVMDAVSAKIMTPLLREAEKKRCALIFGKDLFTHQARGQFKTWGL